MCDPFGKGLQRAPTKEQWGKGETKLPSGRVIRSADVKAKIEAGEMLDYDEFQIAKNAGWDTSTAFASKVSLTPSVTDQAAQAAKRAQTLSLITGRGRRASMANGEYDDSMLGGFW